VSTHREPPWYAIHGNVVMLTRYLADQGYEATEVAYAVEKPHKFEVEFEKAKAAFAESVKKSWFR
jgi:hypothetical protein